MKLRLPRQLVEDPLPMLEAQGEISIFHLVEISTSLEVLAAADDGRAIDGAALITGGKRFLRTLREAARSGRLKTRREPGAKFLHAFASVHGLREFAAAHGKKLLPEDRERLHRLCDRWIEARERHGFNVPARTGGRRPSQSRRGPPFHFADLLEYAEDGYSRGEGEADWPTEAKRLADAAERFPGKGGVIATYTQIRKCEPLKKAYGKRQQFENKKQ